MPISRSFIGPSYYPADVQRTVNMIPLPVEPGNTKTLWRYRDIPGLSVFANIGGGEFRGGKNVLGRVFVVIGSTLYELFSGGTYTSRGTLSTSTGLVDLDFNTTQLGVSDSSNLYVLTLATNVFASVAGYPGGGRFSYLNQYGIFRHLDSGKFGWTDLADFGTIDALSFATAERSPDDVVGLIVDHGELVIGGEESFEVWQPIASEAVFQRNDGAQIETGLAAEFTLQKLDGSVYWLSQDSRGQGHVMKMSGYQPSVVSTEAISRLMRGLDLSESYAFTLSLDKSQLYCLQVPGLDTTLVFDTYTGLWHEWAELVDGEYAKHRATGHVWAFQKNLIGDADGVIYYLDHEASNLNGDVLCRDRVWPDDSAPSTQRVFFGGLALQCDVGNGGTVMYRKSNDGMAPSGTWQVRSLGAIGERTTSPRWNRDGSAENRIRQVRCTDDVPFNPVAAYVD